MVLWCLTICLGLGQGWFDFCWIKIIGFKGLMKCTFHLPKRRNDFNLIKFLPWPICVSFTSPPSSSSSLFFLIPLIDQWNLNIPRLSLNRIRIRQSCLKPSNPKYLEGKPHLIFLIWNPQSSQPNIWYNKPNRTLSILI